MWGFFLWVLSLITLRLESATESAQRVKIQQLEHELATALEQTIPTLRRQLAVEQQQVQLMCEVHERDRMRVQAEKAAYAEQIAGH